MSANVPNEGFKGEKGLTIFHLAIGIISTLLLIKLTVMQHEYFKNQLNKQKNADGKWDFE